MSALGRSYFNVPNDTRNSLSDNATGINVPSTRKAPLGRLSTSQYPHREEPIAPLPGPPIPSNSNTQKPIVISKPSISPVPSSCDNCRAYAECSIWKKDMFYTCHRCIGEKGRSFRSQNDPRGNLSIQQCASSCYC